ncbi:MAG: hypothetical protein Ct9H90mP4_03500 [Gammaproteobacteria bacterium]|nr:MAG: hypothetical protein Ct9H90mP4_03500 [Gammaproteobacteria bacterium]
MDLLGTKGFGTDSKKRLMNFLCSSRLNYMSSWFDKILPSFIKKGSKQKSSILRVYGKLFFLFCSSLCPDLETNLFVCNKCDHHIRIGARKRLDIFLDEDNREEILE